ncbi:restriction endonuclease subunit S [Bacteroides caecimuris]|uniref:restriction endonuclease subunit S n=2 Tax=Bacteroides caecimuris TaxID=1796613 RepID=UPI0025B79F53|nr:restriction endonuclease subunit S [Bacteroides caecimuris]
MKIINLSSIANPISISVQNPSRSDYDRFIGLEHYDSGEPVITRFQGTELLTTSAKAFKANDILIARRNVYLKRAGIVFFDGITSGDSIILRLKEDTQKTIGYSREDLIRYIPFMLNSEHFWIYANKHADGMNSKRISKDTLLEYEFELPSIDEMRDISDKLWAAYRLKEAYKKLLVTTDEMVKSQFIEMFENVESYCKLEDLISDTFPGEWGSEPISENAIKVIRTTNFTNEGYLDLTDVVTRDIEPKKVVRKKLKQGDTILERSGGTKDNPVGRVVFFDEIGDYLPNNFTQVLRPKESVNPVYLFYALYNSYNLNKAAMRAMASQTTGIQNLSMSDFMAKSIVLPSRDEQNKFEQIYRQADKSKFELKQCIEHIDKVIKSLING